jgi:2-polyprenyl-6-methoxyphenol hydroxylase-like FAD-dependent oxidoreductase
MHTERTAYDVVVVGAGPAGLTTAVALSRHGVRPLVVERHAGTSIHARATGVSTRTVEILRSWGLQGALEAAAFDCEPAMARTHRVVDPPYEVASEGFPTPAQAHAVSPVAPVACPQDLLEPLLLAQLRERGGEVLFRTEVVGLAQDADGVTLRLRHRDTGAGWPVTAAYAVGADGPRSAVRGLAGIGTDELGRLGDYLAVHFRAQLTGRLPGRPYGIYSTDEGVFVPAGRDRWLHGRLLGPGETAADWTPQRCLAAVRAGTGVADLAARIDAVMPFRMAAAHARAYRSGRVFLVGDAAHTVTPVGGTGLNTAVHAGHNLGWKLAWVLRGWAAEDLLDTYEAERRPVGARVTARSLHFGSRTVEAALAADLDGRAPHAWVDAARTVSTVDLFDGRLTVLTGRSGWGWRAAAAELAGSGLPLVALSAGHELADAAGELTRAYGLGERGAALVRPDGRLAWTASDGDAGDGDAEAWPRLAAAVAGALGEPLAVGAGSATG